MFSAVEEVRSRGAAVRVGLLFFLLVNEFGDLLCAFETCNGRNPFGEDASVWIELLNAFDGGKCARCFFKDSHGVLLLLRLEIRAPARGPADGLISIPPGELCKVENP